jgi:phage terminase Nu1 subunit (DNA packaging protein)
VTTPEEVERARRDKTLGIPNFTALREWIDKLEEWCRDTAEDLAEQEKRAEQADEMVARAEVRGAEGEAAISEMESMREELADVERGITTFAEFMEKRRRGALY